MWCKCWKLLMDFEDFFLDHFCAGIWFVDVWMYILYKISQVFLYSFTFSKPGFIEWTWLWLGDTFLCTANREFHQMNSIVIGWHISLYSQSWVSSNELNCDWVTHFIVQPIMLKLILQLAATTMLIFCSLRMEMNLDYILVKRLDTNDSLSEVFAAKGSPLIGCIYGMLTIPLVCWNSVFPVFLLLFVLVRNNICDTWNELSVKFLIYKHLFSLCLVKMKFLLLVALWLCLCLKQNCAQNRILKNTLGIQI